MNRCTEQVKSSQYLDLAHDLEIDKAIMFLKQKDFTQVHSPLNIYIGCIPRDEKFCTTVEDSALTPLRCSFKYL